MITRLEAPVAYSLPIGDTRVPLNPLLGKTVALRYSGQINCVHCGRNTNKSFNQGYCYPCFQSLAQCDSCIIHPEKCHYDLGTCREPEWGEEFCMQDHIVYLANSSGVKVGITRATQIPTRWIDQGAVQALAIIRVRSRLQSGSLEVLFKQHVADKTNWRDMLKGSDHATDLFAERDRLVAECRKDIDDLQQRFGFHAISVLSGIDPVQIEYPVLSYPEKINSFNFDTAPEVEGTLLGIKGQYLIFDTGVINMRRFAGYNLELFA
ncbi:MAG: DUF2797 domain-containing protein [Pseudomonadales bacterium]|nr:DUF2797 domain-containing protein [Pseudomonadales bacterium]MCP5331443.1 DUF2797 domain-containing protein [Pseudomonadales bacterium]MCP5344814.1 DUF2797 domain-containing protein [Pseudomonadales bacterium]